MRKVNLDAVEAVIATAASFGVPIVIRSLEIHLPTQTLDASVGRGICVFEDCLFVGNRPQ